MTHARLSEIDLRPGKTAAEYRSLYRGLKSLALANDNSAVDSQELQGEVYLKTECGSGRSYSLSYRESTSAHAEVLQLTRSEGLRQGRPSAVELLRLQADPSGYLKVLYSERAASGEHTSIKEAVNLSRARVTRVKSSET